MLAKTRSLTLRGIDGIPVDVEADLSNGLPSYQTVGLPDAAVRESKERVASAIRNSGFDFPPRRVTVNLAPAGLPKAGSGLDLAIALGILEASGQLEPAPWARRAALIGELALDGRLRPVAGVLSMALGARDAGFEAVVVPPANFPEASAAGGAVYAPASLREAAEVLADEAPPRPAPAERPEDAPGPPPGEPDFSEVRGQPFAKRGLEIAAAGGHNILLIGPPGTGKSMLAQRLPSILPLLTREEALEATRVHSVCGLVRPGSGLVRSRPFRAPHHSASSQAMVGGGSTPRPGEASLAHHGVLFLDELAEFRRDALEALRQPLETLEASVARVKGSARFPAGFMLAAAMNPCPCGHLGHPTRACDCTPTQVRRYRSRVSGPLLDRIDLRIEVGPVAFVDWAGGGPAEEPSSAVRERTTAARARQLERQGKPNARLRPVELRRHAPLEAAAQALLEEAAGRMGLSARGLDRVRRTARTIADLEGAGGLRRAHVAEAVRFRTSERAEELAA